MPAVTDTAAAVPGAVRFSPPPIGLLRTRHVVASIAVVVAWIVLGAGSISMLAGLAMYRPDTRPIEA